MKFYIVCLSFFIGLGSSLSWAQDIQSVSRLLKNHPIAKTESVKTTEVLKTSDASFHLVQVRSAEKPHKHNDHDLTVLVLKGKGILYLNGKPVPLRKGDSLIIPKGTSHHFVNGRRRLSVAWATFTPPFDGKDVVHVSK